MANKSFIQLNQTSFVKESNINRWAGEDEDDNIKDSWEDEDEIDKQKEESLKLPSIRKKSKINSMCNDLKKESNKKNTSLLKEEMDEKIKLLEIQKEEDLKTAMETFGIDIVERSNIDSVNDPQPKNKMNISEFVDDDFNKSIPNFFVDDDFM